MKAVIWTKYGSPDGLLLQEVEKPVPKDNEVLIRVCATTVTAGDSELRGFKIPIAYWLPLRLLLGLRKPMRVTILGQELAGEIEAVGREVTRFKVGDQVFAATGLRLGAYAEYICMPEKGALALKPANLSYVEAASLPVGGLEALNFLRRANIQSGQKVLISGAGGSIGTYAVQLARYYGAEVTAVDSAEKLDMLGSLGAGRVIDYTKEDFTKSGETYAVIFDVIGKASFSGCLRSLKPGGRFLLDNPSLLERVLGPWISRYGSKKVILWEDSYTAENFRLINELIGAGKIKPVIDKVYPLAQVAEAHRYVDGGHKMGNVVIVVGEE